MLCWAGVVGLAACRSTPDPSSLGPRPADFALSVTVYGPGGQAERALRPGRYLVEADGLLRAVARTSDSFPPPARQLPASEVDRLWSLVRESGLLEPRSRYRVSTLVDAGQAPPDGPPVAAFHVEYRGAHAYARVPLDRGSDEAVLAERVVERLAESAWPGR